jgi:1-acyl-sn-glycerol-3-phosphate acyltransferase
MIPFFSWLAVANDGIAIDRKNRDQAVQAIRYATRSASGNLIYGLA